MGIGAAMAGGNPQDGREDRDFYPTPANVTQALLNVETFTGTIHECACGDGAMAEVLKAAGYTVIATDIEPLDYGTQADFLEIGAPLADSIITNPPFALAAKFIEHGLGVLKPRKMALMLKSTYWHAAERRELFERYRPSAIYPLLWRPDFKGLGRPTMEVQWCVWDREHMGHPIYRPLPNPTPKTRKRKAKPVLVVANPEPQVDIEEYLENLEDKNTTRAA